MAWNEQHKAWTTKGEAEAALAADPKAEAKDAFVAIVDMAEEADLWAVVNGHNGAETLTPDGWLAYP